MNDLNERLKDLILNTCNKIGCGICGLEWQENGVSKCSATELQGRIYDEEKTMQPKVEPGDVLTRLQKENEQLRKDLIEQCRAYAAGADREFRFKAILGRVFYLLHSIDNRLSSTNRKDAYDDVQRVLLWVREEKLKIFDECTK